MKDMFKDPLQLASLVAHQIKGPVAAVGSIVETLLGEFAGPISAKQRDMLQRALSQCEESLLTARRLLAISKSALEPETFVGRADLAAAETAAPRVVKTKVYEPGTPVATGAIAAAVHFGRHAAALVDADVSGAAVAAPSKLPPVDKSKVQVDYHLHAPRGEAAGETWPPAAAIAEARRCLSCGGCFECDNCYKYCPDQAVLRPLAPGGPYRFKLEFCQGCNKCAEQCPSSYIEMR